MDDIEQWLEFEDVSQSVHLFIITLTTFLSVFSFCIIYVLFLYDPMFLIVWKFINSFLLFTDLISEEIYFAKVFLR